MTSALFLSTDTLVKPLEGYAAHRKTPPSTDSLTQRSYLTHNKTAATPNGTAAATVVRREAPHASQSQSIRREARSAKRAAGTDPIQNARSAPLFPQQVIHRRPDIAGPAISLLLGTLRRTQEALAARSAQRGLLACPRTCLKVNLWRARTTTGLSITPCSAILPRRRSQSKGSGSCTRPSSPRPSRPGSYAPREGRGPGR